MPGHHDLIKAHAVRKTMFMMQRTAIHLYESKLINVSNCIITHHSQPGVINVSIETGHKPSGGQFVVT